MNKNWVAIWGNSLAYDDYKVSNYAKNMTVRYVIKPLINGEKIRLKRKRTDRRIRHGAFHSGM